MMSLLQHLIVTPIILPLVASGLVLAFDERRLVLKRTIGIASAGLLVLNAVALLWMVVDKDTTHGPLVYHLGNWSAPFGIMLVADRLSAAMVLLVSVLSVSALIYATARWDRSGPRFHTLFLLLLMGVNGAFLTGDIFNLFVFFEVLLAASYGLVLHGAGTERTSVSLHYITINIAASLFFLIGVALIYSVTGTLNIADIALRIRTTVHEDLALLEAGASILGIAFLVKAGIWPLGFWLPRTYAAAAAPVAAVFAIMTKVGVYIVLRLSLLFFAKTGGGPGFASDWLIYLGIVTMFFGSIKILSARRLAHIAGNYTLVSSGTLIAAIGIGGEMLTAALLFYLVSSTLSIGALFLIIEPVERNAGREDMATDIAEPVFDDDFIGLYEQEDKDEVGIVIPATIAMLGSGFILCSLLIAGLPPLSGFIAKFAIIDALFQSPKIRLGSWALVGLLIFSGLASMIAMTRAGIDLIWAKTDTPSVDLRLVEVAPIALLLGACLGLIIWAGPAMTYLEFTASALNNPASYIEAVLQLPASAMVQP